MRPPSHNMLRQLAKIVKGGGQFNVQDISGPMRRSLHTRNLVAPVNHEGGVDALWEITNAGANAVELWWTGQGKS